MSSATVRFPETHRAESLTDLLQTGLRNPASSPEFDFHSAVNQVLADVGLTAKDSGGKLTFYGQDPIVPSGFKFGAMAAVGLALDPKHDRMFITDFGGSVYSANLDGSNPKTLLIAEGNLTGIAYVELPAT